MIPDLPPESRLEKMRFYRRLLYGCLAVGVLGFLVAETLEYPLVAVGIYWTALLGMGAVKFGTSVPLFDERDRALERRTSNVTMYLVGGVLVVAAPAVSALEATGRYEASPTVSGAILGFSAMFLLYGAVFLVLRYRP
jgi:uncharacterized membrane protein